MDLSLKGRHALVCGASKGIGRATALELAANGATVTAMARSKDLLESLVSELAADSGQNHGYLVADFSDPDGLNALVESLCENQPVHILINNSGGPPGGPAHAATLEEYTNAFTKHLLCSQVLVAAVIPGMQKDRYGRIINIISTSVKQPIPGLGVSNAIRGAVANWAKTLSFELGPDGITVNNVLPGFTETDRLKDIIDNKASAAGSSERAVAEALRGQVPLRRFAQASETANAIAFLASPAAAYISGVNLPVDGGRTSSL